MVDNIVSTAAGGASAANQAVGAGLPLPGGSVDGAQAAFEQALFDIAAPALVVVMMSVVNSVRGGPFEAEYFQPY